MSSAVAASSDVAIFGRVIETDDEELPQEAAQFLLKINFKEADRERMDSLAAKARSGLLTSEEDAELNSYLRVGHLLSLLKSKARQALKAKGTAA